MYIGTKFKSKQNSYGHTFKVVKDFFDVLTIENTHYPNDEEYYSTISVTKFEKRINDEIFTIIKPCI